MNWSDIGKNVAGVAPVLGGVLGGPAGAAAGTLIANLFGVEDDPAAVSEAIAKDPNAAIKLAKLEADSFAVRGDTLQAMLNAERTSQHTTRPRIALGAFRILAFCSIAVVSVFVYAVIAGNDVMVSAVVNGWPFVTAIVAPFVGLLYAYFGILRKESKDRIEAGSGVKPAGLVNSLIGIVKGR